MKKHKITKAKLEKRERKKKDEKFRIDVLFRDGCKCVICGQYDRKKLNVHHIIPRENKDFRWDTDNGITLCSKHHKFSLNISPHRNPFVFFYWLMSNRPKQLETLEKKWENSVRLNG